jgi:hypothetical protein
MSIDPVEETRDSASFERLKARAAPPSFGWVIDFRIVFENLANSGTLSALPAQPER